MSEFARRGLERIQEAWAWCLAYFSLGKEEFIRRYLSTKPELLSHATTAQSYRALVTDLANPPDSGWLPHLLAATSSSWPAPVREKPKRLVHRWPTYFGSSAFRPQSVLVCCFNRLRGDRAAAASSRPSWATMPGGYRCDLPWAGDAAAGFSYAGGAEKAGVGSIFDALIAEAVKLLRGEITPPGLEADEVPGPAAGWLSTHPRR